MHIRRVFVDGNGFVASVAQRPAGQAFGIPPAPVGVVEPVFGNAEVGVVPPFARFVIVGGAVGCHFQDEVRRLALFQDGIALLIDDAGAADVEGDEQVGDAHAGPVGGDIPVDGDFAEHYGGVGVAEVQAQGGLVPVIVDVGGVHHIGARGEVGELGQGRRGYSCRRRIYGWRGFGGHRASRRIRL